MASYMSSADAMGLGNKCLCYYKTQCSKKWKIVQLENVFMDEFSPFTPKLSS